MKTQFSLSLFFCLAICFQSFANTFPIATSFEFTTPGLLRLDHQAIQQAKDLNLSFVLEDPLQKQSKVRLRLTIAGQGIMLQTSEQFMPEPIIAQYQVPVELSGNELAQYFNPEHLTFAGISKEQFLKNGQLPQGK